MRVAGSKCFNHSYNDEPQTVFVFIKLEEFVQLGGLYVKPAQNVKTVKINQLCNFDRLTTISDRVDM